MARGIAPISAMRERMQAYPEYDSSARKMPAYMLRPTRSDSELLDRLENVRKIQGVVQSPLAQLHVYRPSTTRVRHCGLALTVARSDVKTNMEPLKRYMSAH